jgi:hypothetical protein
MAALCNDSPSWIPASKVTANSFSASVIQFFIIGRSSCQICTRVYNSKSILESSLGAAALIAIGRRHETMSDTTGISQSNQ